MACESSRQALGGRSSHDLPVGSCGRDMGFESTDAESKGVPESAFEKNATAFDEAARRFAFSQRETQVIAGICGGKKRSLHRRMVHAVRAYGEDSYQARYAKAGVHSRQEFLDAIERVESDLLHEGALARPRGASFVRGCARRRCMKGRIG